MNHLGIVIPYYKINFFEETIKSLAKQTDKRFTLYIGNDNSPNDPLPVIEKYFERKDYNYFNYKKNVGGQNLALQWERILENVTEPWFQILGDDDMISENFVEEFYLSLPEVEENNISVIRYSQHWIDESNNKTNDNTVFLKLISSKENWESKYFKGIRSSLSEYVFKRKTFNKYGFHHFPLAWFTDDLAVLQCSEKTGVLFIGSAEVMVRISHLNISNNSSLNAEKEDANYLYEAFILNNYSHLFTTEKLLKQTEIHLWRTWKDKRKLKINLFRIYCRTQSWKKMVKTPLIYFKFYGRR